MGTRKRRITFLHSDLKRRPGHEALALSTHRLVDDYRGNLELLALNYLAVKSDGSAILETSLLQQILCTATIDNLGKPGVGGLSLLQVANYSFLPPKKRILAESLKERKQETIIILRTLFQWFGTNVGRCALEELLAIFKEYDRYDREQKQQQKKDGSP